MATSKQIPNLRQDGQKTRILSILGSPRLTGLTARLLEAAEQAARERGCTVERINVANLSFRPCTGCMKCRKAGRCVLPDDDASRIAGLLRESDGVMIGTPSYWGGIPGEMKMLFDRMVYAMVDTSSEREMIPRPLHKGKPYSLVVTSTASWPGNVLTMFTDTTGDLRRIFRPSGFRKSGTVRVGGTRKISTLSPREQAKMTKLGIKLGTDASKFASKRNNN